MIWRSSIRDMVDEEFKKCCSSPSDSYLEWLSSSGVLSLLLVTIHPLSAQTVRKSIKLPLQEPTYGPEIVYQKEGSA